MRIQIPDEVVQKQKANKDPIVEDMIVSQAGPKASDPGPGTVNLNYQSMRHGIPFYPLSLAPGERNSHLQTSLDGSHGVVAFAGEEVDAAHGISSPGSLLSTPHMI